MRHRVYLASSADYWDRCRILADAIVVELGDAEIVSRWHERPCSKYPEREDERAVVVDHNCADMDRATVVVVLCDGGTPRTTFADAGYAVGRGKPVIWVRGRHPTQMCLFDAHKLCVVIESAPTLELAAKIARIIERELSQAVA